MLHVTVITVFYRYTSCMLIEYFFFFFNDTATTEIYTLSLHDALPISFASFLLPEERRATAAKSTDAIISRGQTSVDRVRDRKSTRLNSITPISRMPSSA